ncbi:MAG: alpha/beta hydrolase [Acidobacteriota bacterium]
MRIWISAVWILFVVGLAGSQTLWQPSAGHQQIEIWPGAAPDESPRQTESLDGSAVINVTRPTMTVYSPKGKNTGVAMVVFPGGGYKILAIGLEGTEVCDWLTSKGITCVLLKYRVPNSGPHWEDQCKCHITPKLPIALEDAQRTIGLVRFHAAEWHIDPHRIGVLGFSAGGHLVADTSTHFDKRSYAPVDAADDESCRPDFGVALYPGHMLENTSKPFELNPNVPVTSKTPPTFLLQAEDDPVDDVENSLVYFEALKTAGVPVEMHLYAKGGHAFGLRPTEFPITGWPRLVEAWLRTIGMVSRSSDQDQ